MKVKIIGIRFSVPMNQNVLVPGLADSFYHCIDFKGEDVLFLEFKERPVLKPNKDQYLVATLIDPKTKSSRKEILMVSPWSDSEEYYLGFSLNVKGDGSSCSFMTSFDLFEKAE
ncbi:MAG: hypothetical protein V4439_04300 [Patescibacteria group bacterium]